MNVFKSIMNVFLAVKKRVGQFHPSVPLNWPYREEKRVRISWS